MFQRQLFTWRGEPIADIRAWARERGEKMVRVRCVKEGPSAVTLRIEREESESLMPESFWSGHMVGRYGGGMSETWTEIGREDA